MRATILPKAIILTRAYRAAVSMIALVCIARVYCDLSTASEVFLIFYYPTIFMFMQL